MPRLWFFYWSMPSYWSTVKCAQTVKCAELLVDALDVDLLLRPDNYVRAIRLPV